MECVKSQKERNATLEKRIRELEQGKKASDDEIERLKGTVAKHTFEIKVRELAFAW